MTVGSCLCGKVRYQAEGELTDMHHCHCSMCRKQHGAAFSTFGAVPVERFRWTGGEERLRHYRGPHLRRTFCGTCGSTLTAVDHRWPELVWIAVGTLDDDPGARPLYHLHVDSKATWFTIHDALPRFATKPENGG
jgi:hypothetical protein